MLSVPWIICWTECNWKVLSVIDKRSRWIRFAFTSWMYLCKGLHMEKVECLFKIKDMCVNVCSDSKMWKQKMFYQLLYSIALRTVSHMLDCKASKCVERLWNLIVILKYKTNNIKFIIFFWTNHTNCSNWGINATMNLSASLFNST